MTRLDGSGNRQSVGLGSEGRTDACQKQENEQVHSNLDSNSVTNTPIFRLLRTGNQTLEGQFELASRKR
jgi:hypothetical protein